MSHTSESMQLHAAAGCSEPTPIHSPALYHGSFLFLFNTSWKRFCFPSPSFPTVCPLLRWVLFVTFSHLSFLLNSCLTGEQVRDRNGGWRERPDGMHGHAAVTLLLLTPLPVGSKTLGRRTRMKNHIFVQALSLSVSTWFMSLCGNV